MDNRDTLVASLQSQLEAAKRNEQRLDTIIQAAPFCIHEINLSGQIISMNNAGLKMMEMRHQDEICGIHYIDFVSNDQRAEIGQLLELAFQGQFSSFDFTPENASLIFSSCFAPIRAEDGSVTKVMGITQDITHQKRNEEELLKARKLKSIGVLAGGIAHDFNNILTSMFGHLDLAKLRLSADHPAFKHIETASQAMDSATNLTNQLLTFSQGGVPIFESVDITEVIENAIALSVSGSTTKTLLTLQQDLWMVDADKGQLSQVITNILINACQSMPEGGLLKIDARNVSEHNESVHSTVTGDFVCLKISDEGVGIPKELQASIFDPYFTTKESGNGLGLATAYSIIEKHNGHIMFDSIVGKGTTFSLYLPAKLTVATKNEDRIEGQDSNDMASFSVLLMDDDAAILEVSAQMIRTFGHSVDTAQCGEEAIEKYTASLDIGKPFDAVIMDLTVPGGKGGEWAIGELLAIDPHIRAIVASGYSTCQVMSDPTKYGFRDRLVKPFTLQELEKKLTKIFSSGSISAETHS